MLLATAVRAQGDLRSSIVELEWRTPAGYERCAAVITARRPQGLEAWTAGHCAERPFSVVHFFDGYAVYGSRVRVLARSETVDAALLLLPLDAGRARSGGTSGVRPHGSAARQHADDHRASRLGAARTERRTLDDRPTVAWGRPNPIQQTGALEYEVYCGRCGPGDSGSGVFDAAGHLLGIVYGVTEIDNVAGGRLPDGLYADVIPAGALR